MPVRVQTSLRLPLVIHSRITEEARKHGRSFNDEVINRLNTSLGGIYKDVSTDLAAELLVKIADLESRLTQLERKGKRG